MELRDMITAVLIIFAGGNPQNLTIKNGRNFLPTMTRLKPVLAYFFAYYLII